MTRSNSRLDWWDELDDDDQDSAAPRRPASPKQLPARPKRVQAELGIDTAEQLDREEHFDFSYHASRHERRWLIDSLTGFYQTHWFDDILRLLKGGKEASVYQCSTPPGSGREYLAAKVYRPRQFRQLRRDHLYREGRSYVDVDDRVIRNAGLQHAIAKRTEFGKQLIHGSWIAHEYQALVLLFAAGVDVPEPLAHGDNAILMEYFGDGELPAPLLSEVELSTSEARQLFQRVVHNIELMLSKQRVHGDLSAYNILYQDGDIRLIDFPQAVNPHENRNAYAIFERDVTRVCDYFTRQGVRAEPVRLAARLWDAQQLRRAPEIHPALLDVEDPRDRALWRREQKGK